jgi:protocatechuate 3,4-dioxygenase beta subunit
MMGANRRAGLCMILAVVFVVAFAKPESASAQNTVGEQARQVTCSGKIVDAEGRPIAGARVAFYEVAVGEIAFVYNVRLLKEATTKAEGAFSFSAGVATTYRQGAIIAQKQGLAIGWASWQMRTSVQQDIVLCRPKELTGVVVDENDDPIAEATVFVAAGTIGDKQYLPGPVSRQLLRTRTDQKGHFTFTGLPAGATFEFGIEKAGCATIVSMDRSRPPSDVLQFSPGQGDIKLVVPVEARIAGTVVEKTGGGPVAGAAIMVRHNRMGGYFLPEPTISGADGGFEINALLPGSHTLCLAVPRNVPADWVAEPVEVTLDAGQARTDVRIEVGKGGLLEMRVTEAGSNQPVEGADVYVYDQRRRQSFSGRTDKEGVGRIRLLPGEYTMSSIQKQGLASDARREAITIEDGRTKQVACMLNALPRVTGVVRDSAGKPLEGVQLGILPGGAGEISSDSEGKFEVIYDRRYWDPEETVFCLVARDEGRNLAAAMEIGNAPEYLEIELGPGVILAGKVVGPNGKPIGGARLNLMLQMSNWGSSLSRRRV